MRFDNATGSYFQDLRKAGLQLPVEQPNPNNDPDIDAQNQKMESSVAQQIASRFPQASLTSQQQKQLDGLISQVTPSTKGSSLNPVTNPISKGQNGSWTPSGKQGGKPLTMQTAQQLLQAAGGDKDKARQLATNQGYSF